MAKYNPIEFIKKLTSFGTRQLEAETEAANLIRQTLLDHQLEFIEEKYSVDIPKFLSADLKVDDKNIKVLPTGLHSGEITKDNLLLSSLLSSQLNSDDANLNYSPVCTAISRNNFYFAPSLAFHVNDLEKISNAKVLKGKLEVEKTKHNSINFLIGNQTNPINILFCHYDSIGPGAIDNGSGTALLLQLVIEHPFLLKTNLIVIAGNEELSYDYPVYWGHGYRVFENEYKKALQNAKQILVVDCVGHAEPITTTDPSIIQLGFPLANIVSHAHKITMLYADLDKLMTVYHSEADQPEILNNEFLDQAYNKIFSLIKESQ